MNPFIDNVTKTLLHWHSLYPALVGALLAFAKTMLIVVMAGLVVTLLRHRSAMARVWVWRIALAALAGLMLWQMRPAPLSDVGIQWTVVDESRVQETMPLTSEMTTVQEAAVMASIAPPSIAIAPHVPPAVPWSTVALRWLNHEGQPLWWLGFIVLAAWKMLRSALGIAWLRRHSREASAGLVQQCPPGLDCRLSPRISGPLITGFFRPTVWLPEASEEWAPGRVQAAFQHELAHHVRRDTVWQWLGTLAACAWWWQPLGWLALRKLKEEAELAADDWTVTGPMSAADYAEALVDIAKGAAEGPTPCVGIAMARSYELEQRVQALLRSNPWRNRLGVFSSLVLMLLFLGASGIVFLSCKTQAAEVAEAPKPEAAKPASAVPPTGPRSNLPSLEEQREQLKKLTDELGPEDKKTLAARSSLASRLCVGQERNEAGEKELAAVLAIQERVLGRADATTLRTRAALAGELIKQGKSDEVLKEFLDIFRLAESSGKRPDLSMLYMWQMVANTLQNAQKNIEAEKHFRAILPLCEKLKGKEDSQTLYVRTFLAYALLAQGKVEEAEKLQREVMEARDKQGNHDIATTGARQALISTLRRAGKMDELAKLGADPKDSPIERSRESIKQSQESMQKSVDFAVKNFGPDSAATLSIRASVVSSKARNGDRKAAEDELRSILVLQEKQGKESTEALATRRFLAGSFADGGRLDEAMKELRDVLAIQERTLGKEHLETLTTRNAIADVLFKQGKENEAWKEYFSIVQIMERKGGMNTSRVLMSWRSMEMRLTSNKKYPEAVEQIREMMPFYEKVMGKDNQGTISLRREFGRVLSLEGKHDEAAAQYRLVLEIRERTQGKEHKDTKSAREKLVKELRDGGKNDEADKLEKEN